MLGMITWFFPGNCNVAFYQWPSLDDNLAFLPLSLGFVSCVAEEIDPYFKRNEILMSCPRVLWVRKSINLSLISKYGCWLLFKINCHENGGRKIGGMLCFSIWTPWRKWLDLLLKLHRIQVFLRIESWACSMCVTLATWKKMETKTMFWFYLHLLLFFVWERVNSIWDA